MMHQRQSSFKPKSVFLVLVFACMGYGPGALAGEFTVFARAYVRGTGSPVTVTDMFDVLNPNTTWVFRVINGNLEDDTVEAVSSAFLSLNGVEVVQANDFNQNVGFIEVAVTITPSNTITVEVRGKPGGQLTVHIVGQDDTAPDITSLLPADGSSLNDPRPTISALITDQGGAGLDLGSVVMQLDGVPVAANLDSSDPDSATVSFTPTQDLADGEHTVTVDASDLAGNPAVPGASAFTVELTPPPPIITLSAIMTVDPAVTVSGTALRAVLVRIVGGEQIVEAPVADESFSVSVLLRPNRVTHLFVTSLNASGTPSAPTPAVVTHDGQPPSLFIDFPADGAELTTETTDVAGRVGDMLSGFMGLTVVVNGIPAVVDVGIGNNGTFFAPSVPLDIGANTITATATDELGNPATKQIAVARVEIPPDTPQMAIVSGNRQTAQVGTVLPEPIIVRVNQGDGTPFANKIVTFDVTRSNGRLTADGTGDGSMMLQARTDADGLVQAFWRLGFDAGCGNNRVRVTSTSIAGTVGFCASATPAPARQINIGSGNNQRAEAGGPAAEPLRVWVNDSCNGVPDIPVTFTVVQGGGNLVADGVGPAPDLTVSTSDTGHTEVELILGSDGGNNVVEATFAGNPGAPAVFVVFGVVRDEDQPTTFAGLVLDNASQPIEGATCTLIVSGQEPLETTSDGNGQFRFDDIAGSGLADLFVDGLTATALGGQPIEQGSFPFLHYMPVIVPNAVNSLPTPVLLPPLNPNNAVVFDNTQDVELTVEGIEGLKMIVKAGSMTRADGSVPSPADPAILTLNQVHFDDVPMPMPDGAAPPFAWTLQPAGATFDPPVQIVYPNMSGLPAGSISYFLSFNHDTNRFEIVATGQVSDDGSTIVSDPGAGIATAGWGCNCPPYAVAGSCTSPNPPPNGCGAPGFGWTIPDCHIQIPVCFTEACNSHDSCYGDCGTGATKDGCDGAFLNDVLAACGGNPVCETIAWVYYGIMKRLTQTGWDRARQNCQDAGLESGREAPRGTGLTPPFVDMDGDFLPDDWEISVGLDPSDPTDAGLDPDQDGLISIHEFLWGTDPLNPDSDGDGIDDGTEAFLDPSEPRLPLDDSWVMSVNGQVVTAGPLGTFTVTNISVADLFGPGGPGSPPDFMSDECLRVTGVSTVGGVTRYAVSEPFQIRQGETFFVEELTISDTPPTVPASVIVELDEPVLTDPVLGQTTQARVTIVLADGSTLDVTDTPCGTTFRTSNLDVASVDSTGLVTAVGRGVAFITATNEGATGVARIVVAPADPLTTVEGFVLLEDGTPVEGAEVTVLGQGVSALTLADGSFAIPDVSTQLGLLTARAEKTIGSDVLTGATAGLTPVRGGITDAGIIVLDTIVQDRDEDCLPDDLELALGLDPDDPDTDGDGIPDGEEDFDGDGLSNCLEAQLCTDPADIDTDDDGISDFIEILIGTDPCTPNDDPPIQFFPSAPLDLFVGKSASLEVFLSQLSPSGGLSVVLTSDDPGVATVNASVFIPQGQTANTAARAVITAVAPGSTIILASAPGQTTAAVVVNVGETGTFTFQTSVSGGSASNYITGALGVYHEGYVRLSEPLPPGGWT